MKTYLTIILILVSAMTCMADDVVRLRNGSVIKGTIKEYMITGDSVKIATETGTMRLRLSDVGSMSIKGETLEFAEYKPAAKKKYRWSAEAFAGWDFTNYYNGRGANVGILTTHGVELNPHFFVGGGVGIISTIENDRHPSAGGMLPIYGEIRTNVGGKNVSFTAGFRTGCGFGITPLSDYFSYYAHIDLGVRFRIRDKIGMSITPYVGSYGLFGAFGIRLAVGTF